MLVEDFYKADAIADADAEADADATSFLPYHIPQLQLIYLPTFSLGIAI